MKKKLGFIVLGLAVCVWVISPFLFLPSLGVNGWFITAFVVLGEVFFVLAIFLLGNEYKQKIKDKIVFFYHKTLGFIRNMYKN